MGVVRWIKEAREYNRRQFELAEKSRHNLRNEVQETVECRRRLAERLGLPEPESGALVELAMWRTFEALLDRVEALEARQRLGGEQD